MHFRKWSYKTEEWSLLPGEMSEAHYSGVGVLLGGRWLFAAMGKPGGASDETATVTEIEMFIVLFS